jgi:hypothetical protein
MWKSLTRFHFKMTTGLLLSLQRATKRTKSDCTTINIHLKNVLSVWSSAFHTCGLSYRHKFLSVALCHGVIRRAFFCIRQEFFDNETMALGMTHLYGSLRRCLTSPDSTSSWQKSEIGEKWKRQKKSTIILLFVSNVLRWHAPYLYHPKSLHLMTSWTQIAHKKHDDGTLTACPFFSNLRFFPATSAISKNFLTMRLWLLAWLTFMGPSEGA